MNLPGKLVLGFLQEDNPLKGYFRVRPLLVEDGSEFLPVEDAEQTYLEDGYIRIVPDKNELNHFKSRMRSLGQYCLIDLRRHTGENDKIRPNKNYQREDRNTFIVYSDVITRLPDTFMAEVCESAEFPRPGTRFVMLKNGETLDGPYEWEESDETMARLADHVPADPDIAQPDQARRVECDTPAGPRAFLMRLDALGVREPQTNPHRYAAPRPEPAQHKPESEPLPAAPAPEEEPEAQAAPPSEAQAAPSWIQRTSFPPMRAVSARMSPREQSMVMQSGINPKRGASMRDVVDDQWKQSRLDQLGHPVPARAAGQPVLSPVENAVQAFKEAWDEPNARPGLVRELLRNRELAAALDLVKAQPETDDMRAATQALTELEAERLKALSEIDKLRRDKDGFREQVLEEVKKEHARDIGRLEAQRAALESEIASVQASAAAAGKAAEAAEAAYAKLTDGGVDDALCDALAESRAAGLLQKAVFERVAPVPAPETVSPSAGEIVADLRVRFEKAGLPLDNDDAVHALVCLALGRLLMISGPSGCEKSRRARLLAASLGLTGCGRFAEMRAHRHMGSVADEISRRAPGGLPVVKRPDVKTLLDVADGLTPTLLLVEEVNRANSAELLGELLSLGEAGAPGTLHGGVAQKLSPGLRVAMTALDLPEGGVLSPEVLDRVWFTRIYPEDDAPWAPPAEEMPESGKTLSLAALESAFAPRGEISDELTRRMADLREKLAKIGVRLTRRALTDTWRYCAAARPYMRCDDRELLDRALACRAMPWVLATAELPALHELPTLLAEYPRCLYLMEQPLAMPPV